MEPFNQIKTDIYSSYKLCRNVVIEYNYSKFAEADMDSKISVIKYFACQNILDIFRELVESIHDFDLIFEDNALLKIAAVNDCHDIMKYLLENGIDATVDDNFAIKVATGQKTLRILLENGADPSAGDNYPVCWQSQLGYLCNIKLLAEYGANIHARNEYPLCIASTYGFTELISYLIKSGADIHIKNDLPLRIAVKEGYNRCTKMLLEAGANVSSLTADDIIYLIHHRFFVIINELVLCGLDFSVITSDLESRCRKETLDIINLLADTIDGKQLAMIMAI